MFAMCVHELNRIWAFFLDQNHFESPKFMTLTFDLENGKRTYLIKLWCILYLNAKSNGCILKTVYAANLYITLLQRRETLQWPMVTLTFEIQSSQKKNICTPGYDWCVCQNEGHRTYGLDGVRGHTQTHRGPYGTNNIDYRFLFSKCSL